MMKSMVHVRRYLATLAVALVGSGCVTTENDVALGNPYASQSFQGFASAPGATVEIYAFDKSTGQWEPDPVITTTASPNSVTYGGRTIYPWAVNTTLLDQGDSGTLCRLSPSCTLTESNIRVQFREVDGEFNPLLTFDDGGVSCTMNKVDQGEDLYAAAWSCKGAIYDELSIPVIL